MNAKEIVVIPELEQFFSPLSKEVYQRLEHDVLKNGFINKVILWKEKNAMIDGFNRLKIAIDHNLELDVVFMSFSDISKVKEWMYGNQLTRRNATKKGRQYAHSKIDTSQLSMFPDQIDRISELLGDNIKHMVLRDEIKGLTFKDISNLAKLEDEEVLRIFEKIKNDNTISFKRAKDILKKSVGTKLKPFQVDHAKKTALTGNSFQSYVSTHQHIVKVHASKPFSNIEWLKVYIEELIQLNETAWQKNIKDQFIDFESKHEMTVFDAYKVYIDNNLGDTSKLTFQLLLDLYSFWQLTESTIKIREDIVKEIKRLYTKWKEIPERVRDQLPTQIKVVINE